MNNLNTVLLSVSIALNALLLGLVLGHLSSHNDPNHMHARDHHDLHHHKAKHRFFSEMHEHKREMHEDLKLARREVFDALTADEFDPELYQEKCEKLHGLYGKMAQEMGAKIKEKAQGLSKKDRLKMARELRRLRHKMHHRQH